MSVTRQLAEAVEEIRADTLGETGLSALRGLMLDFIGVAARGSHTASAVMYRHALGRLAGTSDRQLPVIGTDEMMPAVPAAMASSLGGHSIEYDDVHNEASLHPGVVIFPAAMAASVLGDASDSSFIRAVAIGYEVMCRVGAAANPPGHYRRHFHPTGTAGALGAAAAAAAAQGLGVNGMVAAIGIAETMAAGSMAFLEDGAWTKRLNPAIAVRAGIESAALAADGFTGPQDGIGSPSGFLNSFSDDPHPEKLLADIHAAPLAVANTSIKAHTCCRYCQGPIDAVLEIRQRHGVNAADVAEVVVAIPSVAIDIVAEPEAIKRNPRSVVDAQFSLQFGVAAALLFGRAGLAEYNDDVLRLPAVTELAGRVRYRTDPRIDRAYPRKWRAWCSILTSGGERYETWVDAPKGDPENALSPGEIRTKFTDLTSIAYSPRRQDSIAALIGDLGSAPVLKKLLSELTSDCATGAEISG